MAKDLFIKFSLADYFALGKIKTAISVPDLIKSTNNFSVKNRPGCTPSLTGSNPKDLLLKYNVKCNLATSDPNGHDVKVHFDVSKVTPEMKATDLDVKCSCTCPAFLYWGQQWNLDQKDALEGSPRPKLQAPKERLDLRSDAVICKHLAAVFERILPAVQHNIVKIVREKKVKEYNETNPEKTPDRIQREQTNMKRRQELMKKRKTKNKEVEESLLQGLRKRDEELKSKKKDIVKRDELATEPGEALNETKETPIQRYERKKRETKKKE